MNISSLSTISNPSLPPPFPVREFSFSISGQSSVLVSGGGGKNHLKMAGKKSWFQKEFWKGGLKVSKVLNAVPDFCQSLGDPVHAVRWLDQTEMTTFKEDLQWAIVYLLDTYNIYI